MPAAAKKKELRPEELKDAIAELMRMGWIVPVVYQTEDSDQVRFCLPKHVEKVRGGTL